MDIQQLLSDGRMIWGNKKLSLEEIIVRLDVVMGDISRQARNRQEGQSINEAELQKELGNIIFSMIRWCDDLGYDPRACVMLAKQAQAAYIQQKGSPEATPN